MQRIIDILKTLDRRGVDQVICYMKESDFARARCNKHHTYRGGLVDHSLEVYNLMMERRGDIAESSIIVCAFFHDLGKSHKDGFAFSGNHPMRSIKILDKCGFQLTSEERTAILKHHRKSGYFSDKLRNCLSSSDMTSTGRWVVAHKTKNSNALKSVWNQVLLLFSEHSHLSKNCRE